MKLFKNRRTKRRARRRWDVKRRKRKSNLIHKTMPSSLRGIAHALNNFNPTKTNRFGKSMAWHIWQATLMKTINMQYDEYQIEFRHDSACIVNSDDGVVYCRKYDRAGDVRIEGLCCIYNQIHQMGFEKGRLDLIQYESELRVGIFGAHTDKFNRDLAMPDYFSENDYEPEFIVTSAHRYNRWKDELTGKVYPHGTCYWVEDSQRQRIGFPAPQMTDRRLPVKWCKIYNDIHHRGYMKGFGRVVHWVEDNNFPPFSYLGSPSSYRQSAAGALSKLTTGKRVTP